ncbi:MAG: hypothetical protein AAFU67_00325 [Bacteroidota bacterium]
MLQLSVAGTTRRLPSSWDEAGPIAWALLRDLVRHPVGEGKAKALKRLTGLSWPQWRALTEDQLLSLDIGTPWLAIVPHSKPFKDCIRVGGRLYHMPTANFENGSGIGYTMADDFYNAWQAETDEEKGLYQARLLLASLLRPHKKGERIPPSSNEEVEAFACKLKGLGPEWSAQAIMYWSAVRQYVFETYGEWLFVKRDEEDDTPQRQGFSIGWWGVWMDVAKDGVFGIVEQVHRTSFHTLCVYLIKKEEAARAERIELEKMKQRTQSRRR